MASPGKHSEHAPSDPPAPRLKIPWQEFFHRQLQQLYDMEKQQALILPRLAQAAGDEELTALLAIHADTTRGQITRLEEIFGRRKLSPGRDRSKVMRALINRALDILAQPFDPRGLDDILLSEIHVIEQHELACYGTIQLLAIDMGLPAEAELLGQSLEEENVMDEQLFILADHWAG